VTVTASVVVADEDVEGLGRAVVGGGVCGAVTLGGGCVGVGWGAAGVCKRIRVSRVTIGRLYRKEPRRAYEARRQKKEERSKKLIRR
jgi:hypothetical protein